MHTSFCDHLERPDHTVILSTEFIEKLYQKLPKSYRLAIDRAEFCSLLEESFAIRALDDLMIIYLAQSKWCNSYEVITRWLPEAVLLKSAEETELMSKIITIIKRKKHFNICIECQSLNHSHHLDDQICHSCLEKNHHYVF